jgi:hypothetical protein
MLYSRRNFAAAKEYSELKQRCEAYTEAKGAFIQRILNLAM